MLIAGRYEVLEQLGTGSMGTVYTGRDTLLDRTIALKTIRTGATVEPEIRERFYREARACARLQHPNIITVYDVGETDTLAWIAMELLRGSDFRAIIAAKPALGTDVKVAAIIQVCEALAHAHSHGVIHRDIKPSNLFLLQDHTAKVLDFGIARLPSSQLTVAGKILGTPNYMAPEQILGKPSDGRSDLFSAAVVFFEFLTGEHPFRDQLIPRRIVQSEPDSIFDYKSDLPSLLDRILMRSLAKEPESRYATGTELAADLRVVLDALRNNLSPTFSRVELPSDRAIPASELATAAPGVPAAESHFLTAPPGEDPEEWRLSEALRIVPEFETAADRGDLAAAKESLAEIEDLASVDRRFSEACRLCQERYASIAPAIELQPAPPPPPLVVNEPNATDYSLSTPQFCPQCGAVNRHVAISCIQCGAKLKSGRAALPREWDSPPVSGSVNFDRTIFGPSGDAQQSAATAVTPLPAPEAPKPRSGTEAQTTRRPLAANRKVLYGVAAGLVVIALVTVVLALMFFRKVRVEPAVGTVVAAVPATVHAGPSQTEAAVAQAAKGERLNLLGIPLSPEQQWVRVQPVQGEIREAGYARTAELSEWTGSSPETQLALLRNLSAPNENEAALRERARRLNQLASALGTRPAAADARQEAARIEAALAKRSEAVRIPAVPQAASPPVAEKPKAPPGQNARRASLREAQTLWEQSRYSEAIRAVDRVLRSDPGNEAARQLRRRIQVAQEIEAGTTR